MRALKITIAAALLCGLGVFGLTQAEADTSCGRVICLSNLATASLPTCNAAARGFEAFDTTLNAPVFCDGTEWKKVLTEAGGGVDNLTVSGTTTFYVSSSGSDSNDGLSAGAPLATIQAACNKIPRLQVSYPITVSVGAGSFAAGCYLEMPEVTPSVSAAGAWVDITGTLQTATKAGIMSGTVTSAVAGSGITNGTLTVTGAGWTVNELRGLLLEITAGAGDVQAAGAYGTPAFKKVQIVSNTATVITIAGQWNVLPTGTSSFAIRDWATTITGLATAPTTAYGFQGNTASFVVSASASMSSGDMFLPMAASLHIRNFKFTSSSGYALWGGGVGTTDFSFNTCRGTKGCVGANHGASFTGIANSYINGAGGGGGFDNMWAINVSQPASVVSVGNILYNVDRLIRSTPISFYSTYDNGEEMLSNALDLCGATHTQIRNIRMSASASAAAGAGGLVIGSSSSRCGIAGTSLVSYAVGFIKDAFLDGFPGAGLQGEGTALALSGIIAGNNDLYGILLAGGGQVEISPLSGSTCTAGTPSVTGTCITGGLGDFIMDGQATQSYANLRTMTPKSRFNPVTKTLITESGGTYTGTAPFTTGTAVGFSQVAFASLPTCNTVYKGTNYYDTTNEAIRACNGSAWQEYSVLKGRANQAINFALFGPLACSDSASITVTGAAADDVCILGVPTAADVVGVTFTCRFTAADTAVVRACCVVGAAGTCDPGNGTFKLMAVK